MISLTARHLLYARVESSYSQKNRNGYQVVYHTPDLSAASVQLIEKRMQCYAPVTSNVTRHQFFMTEDTSYVFTQSTQLLPEMNQYREVIDREGRPNAFIAHALVLTPNQFAEIEHNPFVLFDKAQFINSIDKLVNQIQSPSEGVAVTGNLSLPTDYGRIEGWSKQDAETVYVLSRLGMQKNSVNFVGPEQLIRQALITSMQLATKEERAELSFDTVADGCNPPAKTYWCVGSEKRLSGSHYISANLKSPPFSLSTSSSLSIDIYDTWLRSRLHDQNGLDRTILELIPNVQTISQTFHNGTALPKSFALNETVAREVIAQNKSLMQENLATSFLTYTSKQLAANLSQSIVDDKVEGTSLYGLSVKDVISSASQKTLVNPGGLAEVIYKWATQSKFTDLKGERNLMSLADETRDPKLKTLALVGIRPGAGQMCIEPIQRLMGRPTAREEELALALDQLSKNKSSGLQTTVTALQDLFGERFTKILARIISLDILSNQSKKIISQLIGE